MAGSAITRETPQQQLDLTDPKNWDLIHSWLKEYNLLGNHLKNAGLTMKTLQDLGFIDKIEPYNKFDKTAELACTLSRGEFSKIRTEANIKLDDYQAKLINP